MCVSASKVLVNVSTKLCLFAEAGMVKDSTIVQPLEAQKNDLLSVHSQRYINCLKVRSVQAKLYCQQDIIYITSC